jgi:hypothetical protein
VALLEKTDFNLSIVAYCEQDKELSS